MIGGFIGIPIGEPMFSDSTLVVPTIRGVATVTLHFYNKTWQPQTGVAAEWTAEADVENDWTPEGGVGGDWT